MTKTTSFEVVKKGKIMLLNKENIQEICNEISKKEVQVVDEVMARWENQRMTSEDGTEFKLSKHITAIEHDEYSILYATFELYSDSNVSFFKGTFDNPKLCWRYSVPIAYPNPDGTVDFIEDVLNTETKITFDRPANRKVDTTTDIKITIKGTVWGPIVTTARTYKEDLAPYKDVLVTYHEVTVEYDDGNVYPLADKYYQYTGDYILVKGKDLRASYNFSREVSSNVYNELLQYLDQDFGGLYD